MLLNEFLKEHRKIEEQSEIASKRHARQQKQIEALTAGLQKVSAQLETSKPAPQMVNNPKAAPHRDDGKRFVVRMKS